MKTRNIEIRVGDKDSGMRLDVFLAGNIKGLSRRKAVKLIGENKVLLDGKSARKGRTLVKGQCVSVLGEIPVTDWRPVPDPSIRLDVLFENDGLIAISKPAGIPSVPLGPEETGCLANGIAHRFPQCMDAGRKPLDAGLLGRLDTGTSGLVIAAKTKEAFEALLAMQDRGEIKKYYLAVCLDRRSDTKETARPENLLPRLIQNPLPMLRSLSWEDIGSPLAASSSDDARVVVAPGEEPFRGQPVQALTQYSITGGCGDLVYVVACIKKAFRHQIRVHLAHAGLPLASDPLYGQPHEQTGDSMCLHSLCHVTESDQELLPGLIFAPVSARIVELAVRASPACRA